MGKKLTVLRNERSTYEVHVELPGDPPRKLTGGLSLDLDRLKTELHQHGCPEDTIVKALQDLENQNSTVLFSCS